MTPSTASGLEIGITLPQLVPADGLDRAQLRRYLPQVERLGFASVWVAEMHGAPQLDPLISLAYAAALTDRVRLGVAVLLAALRAPLQLARDVASIDQLSGGRIDLGVGLGADRELPLRYGISPTERATRYDSGLDLLLRLWSQDSVSTSPTSPWPMHDVQLRPRPVQRPHPPLWFGARSESGIARSVRVGDGWIGAASWPLADLPETVLAVRRELDRAGRDPATFRIGRKVAIQVDDDADRAAQIAGEYWATLGRPQLADQTTVTGTAAQVADRLIGIARLGLGLLVLDPLTDQLRQAEQLATEVLPLLAAEAGSAPGLEQPPLSPAAAQGDHT